MTLAERIKACRQKSGLSQEAVAALVGVSRQAVTKWETGQTAPSTENLFKLAEVLGTSVDLLLTEDDAAKSAAAALFTLIKKEEAEKERQKKENQKKNVLTALLVLAVFVVLYLLGRILWCDLSQSSVLGWMLHAKPQGKGSYLYGWLTHKKLFWWAMLLPIIVALCGKRLPALVTTAGFTVGLILGTLLSHNPSGIAYGQSEFGWAYWALIFLVSFPLGFLGQYIVNDAETKGERPPYRKLGLISATVLVVVLIFVWFNIPKY